MQPLKILLLGKDGQLGQEFLNLLAPWNPVAWGRKEVEAGDEKKLLAAILAAKPEVIVNAAAYTQVEEAEKNIDAAMAANARLPQTLARAASEIGAFLVHFSTDYVFDGEKGLPYTEDDTPCPACVYGQSKLLGEEAIREAKAPHWILRTSWLYASRGRNFLLQALSKARAPWQVVADQWGTPNWARTTALTVLRMLEKKTGEGKEALFDSSGTYHLSDRGCTSWYGFARAIIECAKDILGEELFSPSPVLSEEYPQGVRRPRFSALDAHFLEKTFGVDLPAWHEDLVSCLESMSKTSAPGLARAL